MFEFIWSCVETAIEATLGWFFILILSVLIAACIYFVSMFKAYLTGFFKGDKE